MLLTGSLEVMILILVVFILLSLIVAAIMYQLIVRWIPKVKSNSLLRFLILPTFCILFSMILLYYLLPILF